MKVEKARAELVHPKMGWLIKLCRQKRVVREDEGQRGFF